MKGCFKSVCLIFISLFTLMPIIGCTAKDNKKTSLLPEGHSCRVGNINHDLGTLPNLTDLYARDQNRNVVTGFRNMYHATIVKHPKDKEYPYRMYFFGWAYQDGNPAYMGCDAIFLARGRNFDKWEIYSKSKETDSFYWDTENNTKNWYPVVTAQKQSVWYDNWHAGDPSVVYKDGKYYMAYSAYNSDVDGIIGGPNTGDTDGDLSCIMGAVSEDGIHWTKSDYPILIWEEEKGKKEPITSDGSDFTSKDGEKPFYGLYHRPSIMYDEGKWKIWFDYIDGQDMSMGYAENTGDFLVNADWKLVRGNDDPCIKRFPNPDVIKIGKKYIAYADPDVTLHGGQHERLMINGWTKRQLVEAQSDDGIHWTLTGWILPEENSPANHVPTLYYEDGHLYLFYATQIGNRSSDYNYRYDNIRYMVRCWDYENKKTGLN